MGWVMCRFNTEIDTGNKPDMISKICGCCHLCSQRDRKAMWMQGVCIAPRRQQAALCESTGGGQGMLLKSAWCILEDMIRDILTEKENLHTRHFDYCG